MLTGVLAVQGDFAEHAGAVERAGGSTREVRQPRDLKGIDAIILPGGESTTMTRMLQVFELFEPLQTALVDGLPAWGTCAGMILLANRVRTIDRPTLAVLDIEVLRNGYGRQVDSFEEEIAVPEVSPAPLRAIFIRAPRIESVGVGVEVIARSADGRPVAVRTRSLLATSFHPELGDDVAWHRYFLEQVASKRAAAAAS